MKLLRALRVSITPAIFLSLGACAITVSDDGVHRYDDHDYKGDYMTITLPDGDRTSFRCPKELNAFIVNEDSTDGIIYGCRSDNFPVPDAG